LTSQIVDFMIYTDEAVGFNDFEYFKENIIDSVRFLIS